LYILRNQLELNGAKYGCGIGQCGACMVLMGDQPLMSCLMPISSVGDNAITTLAGLADADGILHRVQQAFIEEQAAQCGYCTNGMIIAATALLERNPNPDEQEIRDSMQINLCRCGTQSRVMRAIKRVIG
jgi:aerobic-type carbon monoxide dehydrogenase small subunit (CoxS/CutS family)